MQKQRTKAQSKSKAPSIAPARDTTGLATALSYQAAHIVDLQKNADKILAQQQVNHDFALQALAHTTSVLKAAPKTLEQKLTDAKRLADGGLMTPALFTEYQKKVFGDSEYSVNS